MTQKIALLLIHGIGKQDEDYAHHIIYDLKKHFAGNLKHAGIKNSAAELVVEDVYWAPVFQQAEEKLWKRIKKGGTMNFIQLRRLMIDFVSDSVAYMKIGGDTDNYHFVHKIIAKSIDKLGYIAGDNAPLCIVAHSLGSVMISNYIWDLQNHSADKQLIEEDVYKCIENTPIERGDTFCKFYTLGSPLALWSLRHKNFGMPITVPSPNFKNYYPKVKGEWINYYDKDDIIGYPLKTLNKQYEKMVSRDIEINVGNLWSSWNPASHLGYWEDDDVIVPIAESLSRLWLTINEKELNEKKKQGG